MGGGVLYMKTTHKNKVDFKKKKFQKKNIPFKVLHMSFILLTFVPSNLGPS